MDVASLALAAALATQPTTPLDPQALTLLNVRLAGSVLQTYSDTGAVFPEPYGKLASLDSLKPLLGSELRRELATRDGWGRPLRVLVTDAKHTIIISYGADGVPDMAYEKLTESDGRPSEDLDPTSTDRDTIAIGGIIVQQPRKPVTLSRQASADIRTIGTAIESFAVDNDRYPGPTGGMQPVDVLVNDLEPIYIKQLPREDPWHRPYYVWSDGTQYVVVSGGADGLLDRSYPEVESLEKGQATTDEGADIVFLNGQFVRWPKDAADDED